MYKRISHAVAQWESSVGHITKEIASKQVSAIELAWISKLR